MSVWMCDIEYAGALRHEVGVIKMKSPHSPLTMIELSQFELAGRWCIRCVGALSG